MVQQAKKEPHGIGGWLGLLCFALLMTGSLDVAGALVAFKEKSEGSDIGGYLGIALGIFTVGVLASLFLHRRIAIKLVYSYLLVQTLFWLAAAMLGESVKYFVGTLTVCVAWALYFHRSQRVRNTFYRESAPSAEQPASSYIPFPDVK